MARTTPRIEGISKTTHSHADNSTFGLRFIYIHIAYTYSTHCMLENEKKSCDIVNVAPNKPPHYSTTYILDWNHTNKEPKQQRDTKANGSIEIERERERVWEGEAG